MNEVLGQYRPAPASFNRSLGLGLLAGVWVFLAVLQAVDGAPWKAVAYALAAVGWVWVLWSERHPGPAAAITCDGLRVRRWSGRWREVPWSDVERVGLVRDAQGWSAVRLVDGRKLRLVGVPHDVVRVLAAHVQALRAAPAEG